MKRDTPFGEGMPTAQILIVDDDEVVLRLLSHILQPLGEIHTAFDGEQALTILRERPIDLVLLDVEMPGLNGFELCSMIKADSAFADLPILFVSGHSDTESETRGLEVGAVDYIMKPPSPPIVRARVRTHLVLRQRTQKLLRLAWIDGLTGLANRRAFDQAITEEWRRARRNHTVLSLAMIDIDYFKHYNDFYGHQAGDDCLKMVAATLADAAERPGEMVSRYGGEEFAVVLPFCSARAAHELAEKMRRRVSQMRMKHAKSPLEFITISCGVATLSASPDVNAQSLPDGAALIAAADQALYVAKRQGRDQVVAAPDLV